MAKAVFDIGERAGFLTIIAELPKGPHGHGRLLVRCSCGTEKAVRGTSLRAGDTVSCGCHRRATTLRRSLRHGETRQGSTAEYKCWARMKDRCLNTNNPAFHNYGGRGVTICDRWRDSYANFLADMGRRPSPRHSIERKNNDQGYCKSNCKWATPKEQAANRRPRKDGLFTRKDSENAGHASVSAA